MTIVDMIGFAGVSMILLAYFLNLNQRLQPGDWWYIGMNLLGSMLACLASVLMLYWPFVLLEGVWMVVSLMAAFNKLFPRAK